MTVKPTYEELERRVQELEKIESELEYSKEMLQAYEKASLGYQSLDKNGHYITVNQTWLNTLGYTKEEVIGKSFADFIHPDWQHHFKENFPRFKFIGEILGAEFEMVKKNGDLIKVSLTGKISRNKKGDFQQTHCIFHDITQRKRTEEDLQKSEQQFRDLYDNAPVGYFEYDLQGNITRVNLTELKMMGYTAEEMIGQPCWKFIVDEVAREQILDKLRGVRPPAVGLERTYRRKDGTTFPVLFEDRLLTDEDDHIKGIRTAIQDITERKRMEESLREREERYRLIFNMGANAMFLVDDNTTQILECNNKASQLFGYSSQKLLSLKMTDLSTTPEETRRACQKKVLKKERVYKNKDGSLISVDITSEHFYLDNKSVHISAIRNITDKKLAEKALREKTKFLQNIIDTTSDLVSVTDMDGNFTFIGPSHSILGYELDSLVGRNVMEFVHPDDYQKTATAFAEFLTNREDGRKVEYRYRRADGDYLWFETVGKFIFDDAGNPKEILFSSRDFTARKQAEEAVKENEQKFRTIFNSNMDSISLLDIGPDGKPSGFIDCNDAACEILGYSKEELKLKKLEDFEIPVPESVMIQRLESLQTKGSVDYETVIKDKNGNDRYVEVKAVQMNLPNQPVIMNISRDITERKQVEAKISYLQKSESLGRMAAAVAHHFNNQLYVVLGNLEMVLDDLPDDAENRENLSQAFEAARKAADQSGQMLDYLGDVSGNRTTINLSDVCRQSLTFLKTATPNGVTLKVDFPDSGPFVHADAVQIQQAVTNLFTNAQESLPDNQGIIGLIIQTVSHEDIPTSNRFPLDWQPQNIPYAYLEISDTGCGISKQDIEKIFDPFFSTKFVGRGMGLSLIIGILKTHNGCITVDSKQGCGSIFRVYLPLATEKQNR